MRRKDEQPPAIDADQSAKGEAIARLETELAELRDQLLRALADQENLRRRAAREREDAVRFAASNVIKDLLPTADSIRRAIESVPGDQVAADQLLQNLLAGVVVTEQMLLDGLGKHGISRIDPELGEAFDPHRHHAIVEVDDDSAPAGTVAQVLQPGYLYHDRLLRPALVGVAKRRGDDRQAADT